jgi:hypothetical protein
VEMHMVDINRNQLVLPYLHMHLSLPPRVLLHGRVT